MMDINIVSRAEIKMEIHELSMIKTAIEHYISSASKSEGEMNRAKILFNNISDSLKR